MPEDKNLLTLVVTNLRRNGYIGKNLFASIYILVPSYYFVAQVNISDFNDP